MSRRVGSLGVDWFLPHPKGGYYRRRFTTTTVASSDLIALLARDGLTWREVRDAILYDSEAKAVAERFVEEGYEDVLASEHVSF